MGEVVCVWGRREGWLGAVGLARGLTVLGCSLTVSAADDAHGMQQTRTATGKGNPTV